MLGRRASRCSRLVRLARSGDRTTPELHSPSSSRRNPGFELEALAPHREVLLDHLRDVRRRLEPVGVATEMDAAAPAAGVPQEVLSELADREQLRFPRVLLRTLPLTVLDLQPHVLEHRADPLVAGGRRRARQPPLRGAQLAEDRRVPAGAAGDEHRVARRLRAHAQRVVGGPDVPRAQDGDRHRRLDRTHQLPARPAGVHLIPRPAMERDRRRSPRLGGARDLDAVHLGVVPARPDLDRDRHRDRAADGAHRLLDPARVAAERGARAGAADLLHRARHVDVDDPGAGAHRHLGATGEHVRLGREDLHRERVLVRLAIEVALGLERSVDEPVGAHHLGVREARAHGAADGAERAVGDAGERCEEEPAGERVGTDLHGRARGRRPGVALPPTGGKSGIGWAASGSLLSRPTHMRNPKLATAAALSSRLVRQVPPPRRAGASSRSRDARPPRRGERPAREGHPGGCRRPRCHRPHYGTSRSSTSTGSPEAVHPERSDAAQPRSEVEGRPRAPGGRGGELYLPDPEGMPACVERAPAKGPDVRAPDAQCSPCDDGGCTRRHLLRVGM